jgi:hypothetical protein
MADAATTDTELEQLLSMRADLAPRAQSDPTLKRMIDAMDERIAQLKTPVAAPGDVDLTYLGVLGADRCKAVFKKACAEARADFKEIRAEEEERVGKDGTKNGDKRVAYLQSQHNSLLKMFQHERARRVLSEHVAVETMKKLAQRITALEGKDATP